MIEQMKIFLNSNFFIAMSTLVVGGTAIFLYVKQRRDSKRQAAKLILQEIRYAEQIIRNAKTQAGGNYNLSDKLLPTNSWNKNIHLFVKDLKESQIDFISRFYSQVQYTDIIIRLISDEKCSAKIISQPLPTMPVQPQQSPMPLQQLPQMAMGTMANSILNDVTSKVELIYNTPSVEKLIKISENKWYHFF